MALPAPLLTCTPAPPPGVVGSLSHSRDLAVAALGRASDHRALGLDIELDTPLDPGLWDAIATPPERAAWPDPAGHAPKRLFSVKESAFKAWFLAGGGRILEFEEVAVQFDEAGPDRASWRVVRQPAPAVPIIGRWCRWGGHHWSFARVAAL
ncbi:MAG: 4'-phosphopantetheinyl transferase superfamily protein [Myxococcota bacterium]